MLWSAPFRPAHTHGDGEDISVGVMAGLVPCPLTLFVMSFAMARAVPVAGVMFAAVMMIDVSVTLSATALTAVVFRQQVAKLFARHPKLMAGATKTVEAVAGAILVIVAVLEISMR